MDQVDESDGSVFYKCCQFVETSLRDRDESHGFEHALAVYNNCKEIWFKEKANCRFYSILDKNGVLTLLNIRNPTFTPWFFITVSSIMHDVCDHKYVEEEDQSLVTRMNEFILGDLCFGCLDAAQIVTNIIENVSFSKEKRGLLKEMPSDVMEVRNIVSDADKLEAIGEVGLSRCIAYQREISPNDSEEQVIEKVMEHCDEKLLKLLPEYIRTPEGKKIGLPFHQFIAEWRQNQAASCLFTP